jgi:integrating conjugative element protein (TIGR03761 family)
MATKKAKGLKFVTDTESPFPDLYSIEGEETALRDLLEADNPDTNDPRWPRVVELENRMKLRQQMMANAKVRQQADSIITTPEAVKVKELTGFVASHTETMVLHTRDAFQMFTGRAKTAAATPGRVDHTITGGARVAAFIRLLWFLTANDNPYADWALISATEAIKGITKELEQASHRCETDLEKLRQRGLDYQVVVAPVPQTVELRFKSPYGFMVAESIVSFDYYVRVLRTLSRHDRLSEAETRDAIYEYKRRMRGVFELARKYASVLGQPNMELLARKDFAVDADDAAKARISIAREKFGSVPEDVFMRRIKPRHSQARPDQPGFETDELQALAKHASGEISEEPTTTVADEGKGLL